LGVSVSTVETDAQGKIPCLDGLRAVACLMILAYHFGPQIVRNGGPFAFLNQLPPFLFQGVELFFVLSGFLIGGILLDARHSKNYFRTFYARRAFRLLPVYYLLVSGFVLAGWWIREPSFAANRLFEDPLPLWTYWLYLQNFAMATADKFGPGWLAVTWSVAVEEQFYLILPLVIRRVRPEILWKGCVVAWFTSIVLRAVNAKFQIIPVLGSYVLLPFRLEGLALGILIAYAVRYRPDLIARWKTKGCIDSVVAFC
jgi:peptidoglycan/LPS O-acetylase OafA/YrhL